MRARFVTAESPCPICSGYDRMPRDKGIRCSGYIDGDFICCTREEHAGRLAQNAGGAYAHKRFGPCLCGKQHGAAVRDIADAQRAKIIERYPYRGLDGQVVYEAVRLEPKGFRQRRRVGDEWIWNLQGVAPLLYRLPEVVAAIAAGDPIWICEGERDVHALEAVGIAATTNSAGAMKFPAEMAKHLAGADVTIVQDKDDPGRSHARDVLSKIRGVAKSVRIVEAKSGKDARDHLEAGNSPADFVPVWPLEDLRERDPAEWKRRLLRESIELERPFSWVDDLERREEADAVPRWPSGIRGECGELPHFEGFTILAGRQGAAKSMLAIASSLSAVLYGGWDVHYVSSELDASVIAGRVRRFLQGMPKPRNWQLTDVGLGASVPGMIEHLCERMSAQKTLIVLDSISSFADQNGSANPRDPMGISELKRLCIWLMNVRRKSKGQLSFLALSEANADGGTKYRFGDHKADLVISMKADEADPKSIKHIEVTKGWTIPTGTQLRCALDWSTTTLTVIAGGGRDVGND